MDIYIYWCGVRVWRQDEEGQNMHIHNIEIYITYIVLYYTQAVLYYTQAVLYYTQAL